MIPVPGIAPANVVSANVPGQVDLAQVMAGIEAQIAARLTLQFKEVIDGMARELKDEIISGGHAPGVRRGEAGEHPPKHGAARGTSQSEERH